MNDANNATGEWPDDQGNPASHGSCIGTNERKEFNISLPKAFFSGKKVKDACCSPQKSIAEYCAKYAFLKTEW